MANQIATYPIPNIPNAALTDVANTFTTNQEISSSSPTFTLVDTGWFNTSVTLGMIGEGVFLISNGGAGLTGITLDPSKQGLVTIGNSIAGNGSGVIQAAFFCPGVGGQLTAASTITLTNAVHHVTGATAIENINLPANAVLVAGAQCTLIPDDASGQSWATGGNIAKAGTFTQYQAQDFVYDGTNWYPSV